MNIKHSNGSYQVKGMTCVGCELRIEKILSKMEGVIEVHANFSDSSLIVDYNDDLVTVDMMKAALDKAGYILLLNSDNHVLYASTIKVNDQNSAKNSLSIPQFIGIVAIFIAMYYIIKTYPITTAMKPSMGYGALFIIGLFTSIHCLGMCGGITISQCVSNVNPTDGTTAKLYISGMYNLGRVIAYTIVGGIFGALGSMISFTGWAKGTGSVAAGLFMLVLAISMMGYFPWINKIVPRMPRFMQMKATKAAKGKGPFVVGLLTGLLPCGPLQAIQIYALGTGSYVIGALSMFFFSLGTVPLMFGFGAVSTMLGSKFTDRMLKASAVLVLILGIVTIRMGLIMMKIIHM